MNIGERCLKFMEKEMEDVVTCNPNLPAVPRVKEYFSILTRKINNKEVKLGLIQGNWCAAAVSFSLYNSLENDNPMHGYRAGCIEIQKDMEEKSNFFKPDFIQKKFAPLMLGDIVITDRSNPSKPETAWWRHILRVSKINNDDTFECISGNSIGGQYRISKHKLEDKNIVGFGFVTSREIKTIGIINLNPTKYPEEEKDLNPVIDDFYDLYNQVFE